MRNAGSSKESETTYVTKGVDEGSNDKIINDRGHVRENLTSIDQKMMRMQHRKMECP